jgi:hypothetical protein
MLSPDNINSLPNPTEHVMSRPSGQLSSNPPKYRHHKRSGRAVVTIAGKHVYLGKYNSAESHEKYRRLIAEHWATGQPVETSQSINNKALALVTVGELAI